MQAPLPFIDAVNSLASSSGNGALFQAVLSAWDRSFMNYTADAPGHWRDPEGQYSGDLELPSLAVPFLLLLAERAKETPRPDNRILAYVEFFSAVWRSAFDRRNCRLMLPLLEFVCRVYPQEKDLKLLLGAVREYVSGKIGTP